MLPWWCLSHAHPAHAQEDQQTHRWTVPHPGVGETVTYQGKSTGKDPCRRADSVCVGGNQNWERPLCLTSSPAPISMGQFPGVTVDRKDGVIRGHSEATVTGSAGHLFAVAYTSEEIVTRQFLLESHPFGWNHQYSRCHE